MHHASFLLLCWLALAAAAPHGSSSHPFDLGASVSDPSSDLLTCLSELVDPSCGGLTILPSSDDASFTSALNFSIPNLKFDEPQYAPPSFLLYPCSTQQVQSIVVCATNSEWLLRVRSGGHGYTGQGSVADDGFRFVLVDLMNLTRVTVDVAGSTAVVQAGATLGEVYYHVSAASNDSLAFPAGTCPTVGIGGYLAGGGYGLLGRLHGLAADHVLDCSLVAANGSLLTRANMSSDVFWALRGGGGGAYGIVVEWTVSLVPVSAVVTQFGAGVTGAAQVAALLPQWQAFAPNAPGDVYISCFLAVNGDGEVFASFSGLALMTASEVLSFVAAGFPLLNLSLAQTHEMSFIEAVVDFGAGMEPNPTVESLLDRAYYGKSYYAAKSDYVVSPLTAGANGGIETFLSALLAQPHAWAMLDPYGGAMSLVAPDALPFPHRAGNLFSIQYQTVWFQPSDEDSRRAGLRTIHDAMTPFVSSNPRRAYSNYPDADLGAAWNGTTTLTQNAQWGLPYFSGNFERLVEAKTQIDPANVFRNAQSTQVDQTRIRRRQERSVDVALE